MVKRSRFRKALFNISSSIIVQAVGIVIGLIVPRLFIIHLGSTINGLISFISQFSVYMGIIEGGVAAAAGAELYGPLARNEHEKINQIMTAVKLFYIQTGKWLQFFFIIFVILYSLYLTKELFFIKSLYICICYGCIPILGYLFFNKFNMIFVSDQRHYLTLITSAIMKLFIAFLQVLMLHFNLSVFLIVSVVPICNLIRLFYLRHIVLTKYKYINYSSPDPDFYSLRQKWNALLINISQLSKSLIPMFVLTFLFDLKQVSVYAVYAMLFHIGSSILETSNNGLTSTFGNVLHSEKKTIVSIYDLSETTIFFIVCFLSGCFLILTLPFIKLYVGDQSDVNYLSVPLLISFILNEAFINFRFTPKMMLKAVGNLRTARISGLYEVFFCLILTPAICLIWGEKYILFGSVISSFFATIYWVYFTYKYELKIGLSLIYIKILVNVLFFLIGIYLIHLFLDRSVYSYLDWLHLAISTCLIMFVTSFLANFPFFLRGISLLKTTREISN
ncbi:MAG: hypothetical protein ACOX9E_13545 [Lentisphaeria bacterium]|jgi:hypothetical protein